MGLYHSKGSDVVHQHHLLARSGNYPNLVFLAVLSRVRSLVRRDIDRKKESSRVRSVHFYQNAGECEVIFSAPLKFGRGVFSRHDGPPSNCPPRYLPGELQAVEHSSSSR